MAVTRTRSAEMLSSTDEVYVGDEKSRDSQRPKNVPLRLWERFQVLEKRTNEVTKRSTEKRIKHLQKTALQNVARALHHPEDQEMVTLPPLDDGKTPLDDSKTQLDDRKTPLDAPSTSVSTASRKRSAHNVSEKNKDRSSTVASTVAESEEKEWQEVRGLMGVNDHLAGMSHGSLGPKTVLETRIEAAIASGDYGTAEELSDHMANREFGEKVAKAIDAKNFLRHKQEEEAMAQAKRRKKLPWGFEAKHRWETKSNM